MKITKNQNPDSKKKEGGKRAQKKRCPPNGEKKRGRFKKKKRQACLEGAFRALLLHSLVMKDNCTGDD